MAPPLSSIPASNSLWSPLDTVKDAAELLGVLNLPNEVANVVAMDIEYRIFQITEQALKFMRHSKRKTLCTRDINKALKVLNVEPLYGYNVSRPLSFKQALVGPGQTLYYIDDNQVDFEKLINSPLPKVPRLVTFTAHWLAIEGVQPHIPQNPSLMEVRALPASERGAVQNLVLDSGSVLEEGGAKGGENAAGGAVASNGTSGGAAGARKPFENTLPIKPLIKHVISKELQLYFNKIIQVLTSSPTNNPEYEYLKTAALVSLRSDPGLHQLVPYFIQFISETITNNLGDISLLHIMLESIYSLLLNDNIFLDPYIHSLLPCILTLLLAKKIGKLPTGDFTSGGNSDALIENYLDEMLAIREFAASLLDHILKHYGSNYNTLKPRVARTLLKALLQSSLSEAGASQEGTSAIKESSEDKEDDREDKKEDGKKSTEISIEKQNLEKLFVRNLFRNFGSYYGSIIGIRKLGNEIIRLVLVGNLKIWSDFVFFETDSKPSDENGKKDDGDKEDEDIEMKDSSEDLENESRRESTEENDLARKIVFKEKAILISSVVATLRELKAEVVSKDSEPAEVDEHTAERLKERVGEGLGREVLKQPDAKQLVAGIFFGEL